MRRSAQKSGFAQPVGWKLGHALHFKDDDLQNFGQRLKICVPRQHL